MSYRRARNGHLDRSNSRGGRGDRPRLHGHAPVRRRAPERTPRRRPSSSRSSASTPSAPSRAVAPTTCMHRIGSQPQGLRLRLGRQLRPGHGLRRAQARATADRLCGGDRQPAEGQPHALAGRRGGAGRRRLRRRQGGRQAARAAEAAPSTWRTACCRRSPRARAPSRSSSDAWTKLLDAIFVPLGNGSLINGIGTWFKHVSPATEVIGVCAEGGAVDGAVVARGQAGQHRVDDDHRRRDRAFGFPSPTPWSPCARPSTR